MESKTIIVRKAVREDAAVIAEAVAMAIGDERALRNYCGEEYMAVLTEIARHEATQYSWQYALIAEVDGAAAGAIVGYDGAMLHTLREGTFATLRNCIGRTPTIVDETSAGEYYLDSVAVLHQFRGMGIGRALVSAFCDSAFAQGHRCVGLIVDHENPDAERLYTSLGFRRVGTRPFFNHQMRHLQRCDYRLHHVEERTAELIAQLTTLWEASVRASHHFLSEEDICEIRDYVPMALGGVEHLVVTEDGHNMPVAFMGVENGMLEMLFVNPTHFGCGIGSNMVQHGIENMGIKEVTVNEQNPSAVEFYKRMGFSAYKRTECDEQGRPFPLIYMRL